MALEDLVGPDKFLAALVRSNPTDLDPLDEGDDHIRGIKNVTLNSLGIMTELMTWPAGTPIHIPNVIDGTDGGDSIQLGRTVRARPDGLDVASETDTVRIELSASGGLRATVSVDPAGDTIIRGNVVGGGLGLGVQGAGGPQLQVEIEADGGVGLNHAGVRKLDSVADGVELVGGEVMRLNSGAALVGIDSLAADVPLAQVVADRVELGDEARAAVLLAPDDLALVRYGGGDEEIIHTGNLIALVLDNLVDQIFPIGAVYYSANNAAPAFGGTWTAIAAGRFVVGVGEGTDGGATGRVYGEGAEGTGRYEVELTEAELALHGHPWRRAPTPQGTAQADASGGLMHTLAGVQDNAPAFNGTPSDVSGEQIGGAGGGSAHENAPPAFGLYVWQRTA